MNQIILRIPQHHNINAYVPLRGNSPEPGGLYNRFQEMSVAGDSSRHTYEQNILIFLNDETFKNYMRRIDSFSNLQIGWNSFDSIPPNQTANRNSKEALKKLREFRLLPDKVTPSCDESIIFEFWGKNAYLLLEFYNDGDIVYLRRNNEGEIVTEDIGVNDMDNIVNEIRNEF